MVASGSPGLAHSAFPGTSWVQQDGPEIVVDGVEDSRLVVWYQRDHGFDPQLRTPPGNDWWDGRSQMERYVLPIDRFLERFTLIGYGLPDLEVAWPTL